MFDSFLEFLLKYLIIFFHFLFLPGEVERLLKEYRQNQELVRRIGGHYYQIIYPVQLRHHEKMGISTREVSAPKVRNRLRYKRNLNNYTMVCSYSHFHYKKISLSKTLSLLSFFML